MKIDETLAAMQEYAVLRKVPIISTEGAAILVRLTLDFRPKSILEIGTAIGYSTLLFAANTSADAQITTIEQDSKRIEAAKEFWSETSLRGKIRIIEGDAGEVLPELEDCFDLVFIDAAKGQYLNYLLKIKDKLYPGAVIIADNVLFRGMVQGDCLPPKRYRTIVRRLKGYLEFVTNDPDFATTILDDGDGIAISYYKRG
jgi:predicted O-methyltransferase YrrM